MVTLYFLFSGLFCFLSVSYIMYCLTLTSSHSLSTVLLYAYSNVHNKVFAAIQLHGIDSSVGTRHLWV